MKALALLVLAACLIAFANASVSDSLQAFSPPSLAPHMRGARHWTLVSERHVNPLTVVNWRIYLQLRNGAELADLALRVADPTSADYGKLVDLPFINEHFTPLQEQVDRVLAWVHASGSEHSVDSIPQGKQYVS